MKILRKLRLLAMTLLTLSCCNVSAHTDLNDIKNCLGLNAPVSLAGMDVVFQIEKTITNFSGGYPYKGAVVKHYKKDGKFAAQGTDTLQATVPDDQQAF